MEIVKTKLGLDENNQRIPDIVLDSDTREIIICSGRAKFIIREIRPETIVVVCPQNETDGLVYRHTIEPVGSGSFWLTQHILEPKL